MEYGIQLKADRNSACWKAPGRDPPSVNRGDDGDAIRARLRSNNIRDANSLRRSNLRFDISVSCTERVITRVGRSVR